MRLEIVLCIASLAASAGSVAAGALTSLPDPSRGKQLAERLCASCHLVDSTQTHANVDVPSFREIAAKSGQTEGAIMAHIMLPKHPMPTVPLTKRELSDLAAYIMSLREQEGSNP